MCPTRQQFQIVDDPEAGSAFALYLSAAGFEVETDFLDGTVFVSVDPGDYQLNISQSQARHLVQRLQERLCDTSEELERAEMSSEFHALAC